MLLRPKDVHTAVGADRDSVASIDCGSAFEGDNLERRQQTEAIAREAEGAVHFAEGWRSPDEMDRLRRTKRRGAVTELAQFGVAAIGGNLRQLPSGAGNHGEARALEHDSLGGDLGARTVEAQSGPDHCAASIAAGRFGGLCAQFLGRALQPADHAIAGHGERLSESCVTAARPALQLCLHTVFKSDAGAAAGEMLLVVHLLLRLHLHSLHDDDRIALDHEVEQRSVLTALARQSRREAETAKFASIVAVDDDGNGFVGVGSVHRDRVLIDRREQPPHLEAHRRHLAAQHRGEQCVLEFELAVLAQRTLPLVVDFDLDQCPRCRQRRHVLAVVEQVHHHVVETMATAFGRHAVAARQFVDLLPFDATTRARQLAHARDGEGAADLDFRSLFVDADGVVVVDVARLLRRRLRRRVALAGRHLLAANGELECNEPKDHQDQEREQPLHGKPPRATIPSQCPCALSSTSITSRTAPKPARARVT